MIVIHKIVVRYLGNRAPEVKFCYGLPDARSFSPATGDHHRVHRVLSGWVLNKHTQHTIIADLCTTQRPPHKDNLSTN